MIWLRSKICLSRAIFPHLLELWQVLVIRDRWRKAQTDSLPRCVAFPEKMSVEPLWLKSKRYRIHSMDNCVGCCLQLVFLVFFYSCIVGVVHLYFTNMAHSWDDKVHQCRGIGDSNTECVVVAHVGTGVLVFSVVYNGITNKDVITFVNLGRFGNIGQQWCQIGVVILVVFPLCCSQ